MARNSPPRAVAAVDDNGAQLALEPLIRPDGDLFKLLKGVHRDKATGEDSKVEAMRELAYVRASLRPMGKSPERVLNLLPYLARFGVGLLLRLRDASQSHAQALVHGTRAVS